MAENHTDKTDVGHMKQLIADIEKRVEAIEKQQEQRKVWVRPTPPSEEGASENGGENGVKQNGVDKELKLTLEVQNATTEPGQNVYATGSLKELGSWVTSGAVKLTTTQDTYPKWRGEVTVHDYNGEPIKFKIFKMTDNNESGIQWDNHADYTITPSDDKTVTQTITWTN